eukprot:3727633-Rhodomonas_salina.2
MVTHRSYTGDIRRPECVLCAADVACGASRLFFMSATASDTLRETNEYLKSTKWIVEEELRKLRNELQGALFDLTKSKLKTIEEFKIRHRSDDYLQQIQDVLDELAEFEKKGAAIIEKEEHFGWPSSNINLLHGAGLPPFTLAPRAFPDAMLTFVADGAVRTANNHKSLWEHNKKIPKTVRWAAVFSASTRARTCVIVTQRMVVPRARR